MNPRIARSLMLHDEVCFLTEAAKAHPDIPLVLHLSRIPWAGEPGDWQAAQRAAEAIGATVVVGDWGSEEEHRAAAMEDLRGRGFTHALIADTDEFIEPRLLQHLVTIAENDLADRVYVEWDTYWKSIHHVVRPRERFKPCILIKLDTAVNTRNRDFIGGRALYLDESYGIIHHLSYVGDDERIWRKITTWGHRTEVVPGWWERVWKGWDADPTLRRLHTTHPDAYDFTERITPPQFLLDLGLDKTGPAPRPLLMEPSIHPWPAISVVIPAHNGQDDLDRCLASLAVLDDLLHEVIVVDNGSQPPASAPPGVTLLRNDTNLGFALASNQGAERGTGDVVLFLNSDTAVPRAGLIRLVESLMASGAIAASGPLTNNSGHFQRINPTFTNLENLDLYASEFAHRTAEDMETDMLVGFCLAVKRRALDEVGLFDPRFGLGTFEDNDLCYRLRRAGYRLVISSRSYVHHEGSKTMSRLAGAEAPLDIQGLLRENHGKYLAKWSADLESGFASHLSGLSAQPITFHQARKPEARLARIQADVQRADISLCMIVKDEERVIKDCLESAKPFFREILILDTGSTDRTVEIAKECGALVTQGSWPDSFALARTQSMAGAKGEWIMWLDADDTLPLASGEAIVRAVASAPRDVVGFVLPVRFVEEQGNGTQVDHVKVFRNYPGLEWEGRIHEQVLPSLRKAAKAKGLPDGGKLARLDAYVLHSGYDNSEIGQVRKRVRDEKLLKLDLAERPDHPFVLFNLGMTAHYTGSQVEAAD